MKYIVWSMALVASLACGLAGAQAQPAAPDAAAAAPSAPDAVTAPAAVGGVQSQNIFQVKPDASADPKYAEQSNGERMKVQQMNVWITIRIRLSKLRRVIRRAIINNDDLQVLPGLRNQRIHTRNERFTRVVKRHNDAQETRYIGHIKSSQTIE